MTALEDVVYMPLPQPLCKDSLMAPQRGLCDSDTSSVPGSNTDVTVTFMRVPSLVPLLTATHSHAVAVEPRPGPGLSEFHIQVLPLR